jgi:hypothetical protein
VREEKETASQEQGHFFVDEAGSDDASLEGISIFVFSEDEGVLPQRTCSRSHDAIHGPRRGAVQYMREYE